MLTPAEKFQAKHKVNPETGCWDWLGSKTPNGYGIINVKDSHISAHRFAFESRFGPIKKGLVIDHLCRNRACVNPEHLRVVTNRENILCGIGPSAKNASKDACVNGHPFDAENTQVNPDGSRRCRACARARSITNGPTWYARIRAKKQELQFIIWEREALLLDVAEALSITIQRPSFEDFKLGLSAHDAKVREPLERRIEELNSKVAAMGVRAKLCYRWLETNQPDVFSRGLYAALGHTHESFKSLEREEAAAHDARHPEIVMVDDLAMLVRLLVHSIRKHSPDNETARKAMDYLRRHELQGSPLRTTILSPAPDAAKVQPSASRPPQGGEGGEK